MRLPLGYFNKATTGELSTTMNENVEKLELFLAHHFPEMMSIVFVPLFLCALLFGIDWRMAVASVAPVGVGLLIVLVSRGGWNAMVASFLAARETMNSAVIEYVQGIKVIKIFNLAAASREQYRASMARWAESCIAWNEKIAPPLDIYQAIVTSTLLFILPVGFWLHVGGSLPLGALLLFLIMGSLFGKLFLRIYTINRFAMEEAQCMERVERVRRAPALPEGTFGGTPCDYGVTFRNVRFGYGDSEVLHGIDFHVAQGKKLAVVGPSGAGKSTLARLVARFWDVDAGAVEIGGVDVRRLSSETLMASVSWVFQDAFLFNDTIYENIRMGKPEAREDEIVAAARAACCHDFIEQLPEGYRTVVGERGVRLSGGEKQRISIARAILKDAPILILDEATVFVDPENEILVQRAIAALARGKTVILIAHRLGTVTEADWILVIEEGKIVEQGDFNMLMGLQGSFHRMWRSYREILEWRIRS